MPFTYTRSLYLQNTDAAGVVYFTQILQFCHEAYETSLTTSGVNLQTFVTPKNYVIPITHTSADFKQPLFCGEKITIILTPQSLQESEFSIEYQLFKPKNPKQPVATALTHHVCIDPLTRRRLRLPADIFHWLERYS